MPDQLRERFDALRNAVEGTEAAGVHDVRERRTRRARTRVAASTATVVAALVLTGGIVLPQLGSDPTSSAGGGAVLSDNGGDAAERLDADDQIGAEQAPAEDASQGPMVLSVASLLSAPELMALGEADPQLQAESPGPVLPPLCGATSGSEQYSYPVQEFSVQFGVLDASLNQYGAQYDSEPLAIEAMDRLLVDTRTCPESADGGSLSVLSSTASEIVVLTFTQPGVGPTGAPRYTDITVVRAANVVFEVALVPIQMGLGDGAARGRDLTDALVAKL